MAISTKDCTILFFSKKVLGLSFEKTLMLGRLSLHASKSDIESCIKKYNSPELLQLSQVTWSDGYAEPLFKILGAKSVDSIDNSDYEKATIIHNMNLPMGKSLHSKFTCIVDGGTLEHVFNLPTAIKNCTDFLEVGGHFIGISPANNQMGHGFYQFSPELFYRIFSHENGFEVIKMFVTTTDGKGGWYEVSDPKNVNSRVMLVNDVALNLVVIAKKIEEREVFKMGYPQQSDYQSVWNVASSIKINTPLAKENAVILFYRKYFPKPLKVIVRAMYDFFSVKKAHSIELGTFNASHFKKVDL